MKHAEKYCEMQGVESFDLELASSPESNTRSPGSPVPSIGRKFTAHDQTSDNDASSNKDLTTDLQGRPLWLAGSFATTKLQVSAGNVLACTSGSEYRTVVCCRGGHV